MMAELVVDWREYVGRHVVLCAYWVPESNSYLVRRADAIFVLSDKEWCRVSPLEKFPDAELRSRIADMNVEAVSSRASIIVTGKVTAVSNAICSGGCKCFSK
jgi:hypothetical protein